MRNIFDYKNKKLLPYDEETVFISKCSVRYNPNAKNVIIHNPDDGTDWDVESWMQSLAPGDPELCNTLWEITGAVLRPLVPWNKSAWLYSQKGCNGKGTLCEMFRALLGEGNYASISISQMQQDFALAPLLNASAIIVDENDVGTYVDSASAMKSLISSDIVAVNQKYKPVVQMRFRGFIVQCLNEYPRIKDKSDSLYRRQLFVKMKACFLGAGERKYIKKDYLHRDDVTEYIFYRVMCKMKDYYELSEPDSCKLAMEEFKQSNDPIRQFWDEVKDEIDACSWNLMPLCLLWDLYRSWYSNSKPSGTIQNKRDFYKDIVRIVNESNCGWYCADTTKQINVNKSNMNGSLPLIAEYGLTEWMSKTYKGNDVNKLCVPVLKTKYAGIERVCAVTN